MSSKLAPLSIDFIIIGAGVTGLATAFRLRKAGHRVTVVEKGKDPCQRPGGAHLPPNLSKLCVEWGLQKQMKRYGLSIRSTRVLDIDSGHTIGALEWREDVLQETGADYMVMQYQDFCQILYDAARDAGVHFELDVAATLVEPDPHRPRVYLADGRMIAAHMVIGADGPRGVVREAIEGPIEQQLEGHSVYVAHLPREQLKDDPELYELTAYNPDHPEYIVWSGDSRHVKVLVTDQGRMVSVIAYMREIDVEGLLGDDIALDCVSVSADQVKIECEPRLRRLLDHIPTYFRKRVYLQEVSEDWIDEHGRMVIMSEAAYPIWPFHIQSCSMPIEDTGVLTTLFAYLKDEEQISHLAAAYQEIRQPRAELIFSKETKGLETIWVPPGPGRELRDAAYARMAAEGHKGWDETKLRFQWDEICEVFAYHGREAAEDWWVLWGVLRERSQVESNPFGYSMSVEIHQQGTILDAAIA